MAMVILGCSGIYPVKGKAKFRDGTPLPAGSIVNFTDEHGASGGYGVVGADGAFEMTFDRPQDGMPKGTFRVSFRPPSPWGMTEEQKKRRRPVGGSPSNTFNRKLPISLWTFRANELTWSWSSKRIKGSHRRRHRPSDFRRQIGLPARWRRTAEGVQSTGYPVLLLVLRFTTNCLLESNQPMPSI